MTSSALKVEGCWVKKLPDFTDEDARNVDIVEGGHKIPKCMWTSFKHSPLLLPWRCGIEKGRQGRGSVERAPAELLDPLSSPSLPHMPPLPPPRILCLKGRRLLLEILQGTLFNLNTLDGNLLMYDEI